MGEIIEASCSCGYKEEFSVGGGMADFMSVCHFPALCRKCCEIVEINMLDEVVKCPLCSAEDVVPYDKNNLREQSPDKGTVTEWRAEKLGGLLEIKTGKHYCPHCGKNELVFENLGSFD